ncbi:uncharacterized protein BJ212DRAFT_570105 [Suillus subaureus]|uniref:Uncharacterized protein n=1 Tax=Suillus subaureus TaxID=48587 RepID=A0A9P7JAF0_9AGAM|nr:uncharacterized protein BJ212DRAFT_570105 [Suillus subaureus]KAG1810829.1 hypothetical protein BJ212DRAFT_570105 [Suillus subaureus]
MAPFDAEPIKSLPALGAGNIVARSYQSGSMDRHTMIDVIVMIVLGTSVPVTNTATPARSTATPGRSIRYSRQILVSLLLHNWWIRAFHNGIPRPVTNTAHHEQTLFHVAQLSAHTSSAGMGNTRSPSFTTFAPISISAASSIVDTFVNSEAVELHMLGSSKTPSTSSLAVADDADTQIVVLSPTEPIARADVGTAPEAPDPS